MEVEVSSEGFLFQSLTKFNQTSDTLVNFVYFTMVQEPA